MQPRRRRRRTPVPQTPRTGHSVGARRGVHDVRLRLQQRPHRALASRSARGSRSAGLRSPRGRRLRAVFLRLWPPFARGALCRLWGVTCGIARRPQQCSQAAGTVDYIHAKTFHRSTPGRLSTSTRPPPTRPAHPAQSLVVGPQGRGDRASRAPFAPATRGGGDGVGMRYRVQGTRAEGTAAAGAHQLLEGLPDPSPALG